MVDGLSCDQSAACTPPGAAGQNRIFGVASSFLMVSKSGGKKFAWSFAQRRAARPICFMLLTQAIICARCLFCRCAASCKFQWIQESLNQANWIVDKSLPNQTSKQADVNEAVKSIRKKHGYQ